MANRRVSAIERIAIVALFATLGLVAWLLLTHATPTTGRPSHGPAISSPTAAYPR